ncbi:hypothetical protein QBC45DRAFT_464250 [Copromyces sp. CBS 386.78]|nr:hypothetical protein QBC45DRAFT_464250 [Copromyces sp. CBS 386.78]
MRPASQTNCAKEIKFVYPGIALGKAFQESQDYCVNRCLPDCQHQHGQDTGAPSQLRSRERYCERKALRRTGATPQIASLNTLKHEVAKTKAGWCLQSMAMANFVKFEDKTWEERCCEVVTRSVLSIGSALLMPNARSRWEDAELYIFVAFGNEDIAGVKSADLRGGKVFVIIDGGDFDGCKLFAGYWKDVDEFCERILRTKYPQIFRGA